MRGPVKQGANFKGGSCAPTMEQNLGGGVAEPVITGVNRFFFGDTPATLHVKKVAKVMVLGGM